MNRIRKKYMRDFVQAMGETIFRNTEEDDPLDRWQEVDIEDLKTILVEEVEGLDEITDLVSIASMALVLYCRSVRVKPKTIDKKTIKKPKDRRVSDYMKSLKDSGVV